MADGREADKTEAYFSGRLKIPPRPRRIKQRKAEENSAAKEKSEKLTDEK